jgi:hypothetical protein
MATLFGLLDLEGRDIDEFECVMLAVVHLDAVDREWLHERMLVPSSHRKNRLTVARLMSDRTFYDEMLRETDGEEQGGVA